MMRRNRIENGVDKDVHREEPGAQEGVAEVEEIDVSALWVDLGIEETEEEDFEEIGPEDVENVDAWSGEGRM